LPQSVQTRGAQIEVLGQGGGNRLGQFAQGELSQLFLCWTCEDRGHDRPPF